MRELTDATSHDVEQCFEKAKKEKKQDACSGKWRKLLNGEQFEMVEMVARRVQPGLEADGDGGSDADDPLQCLLHAGPGTGKSHVIR